tara:strand:- start:372 stop:554 length:183 start_codon:yes stop_codon:yes gene_type:complete
MRIRQIANNKNKFVLINKKKATKNAKLDKNSILGMNIAGKTSRLDTIYKNLLCFSQDLIS